MGEYNFKKDFAISESTEAEIANMLASFYGVKIISFCNTKDYDLLLKKKDKEISIEIKEDFYCHESGNMVLEFSSWERDSGIMTTKADYYIHKLHENPTEYWITKTSKLRYMIEKKLYTRIVCGGDKGSNSLNYLFKLKVFKEHSKQLFKEKVKVQI